MVAKNDIVYIVTVIWKLVKNIEKQKNQIMVVQILWISYTFKENVWVWKPPIDILDKH